MSEKAKWCQLSVWPITLSWRFAFLRPLYTLLHENCTWNWIDYVLSMLILLNRRQGIQDCTSVRKCDGPNTELTSLVSWLFWTF